MRAMLLLHPIRHFGDFFSVSDSGAFGSSHKSDSILPSYNTDVPSVANNEMSHRGEIVLCLFPVVIFLRFEVLAGTLRGLYGI
jgi:hypothetical protein